MAFSLKSFQETLQDVKDARAWYHSIGIPTDNTRLQLIEERITALREALESEPPEKVVERWATAETYYVLSDRASFGRIKREISKVGPNLMPKRSLKVLLEGPLNPEDEKFGDKAVNARNIFAELELAAHFSEKGINPTGFQDLQFKFEQTMYYVQAKRLLSPNSVKSNVRKAYEQLQADLKTDVDRGFIALSVDKLLGLEGKLLRIENEVELVNQAHALTSEFKTQYGNTWTNFVDTRITAILVVTRFLCQTMPAKVIGPAYLVSLIPLVSEGTLQASDLAKLRHLVTSLS